MGSDDFARRLFMLEEAVRKLSTAERANKTDVRDGYTRWLLSGGANAPAVVIGAATNDTDVALAIFNGGGGEIAYLGTADSGSTVNFDLANPDDSNPVFRVQGGVVQFPLITAAWQNDYNTAVDTGGRPIVTSATYVTTHRTVLPITSGEVYVQAFGVPGAGCTMDLRVSVYNFFDLSTRHTVVEQTGITTFTGPSAAYAVPAALAGGNSPIGMTGLFIIEARRTAGANNCAVAPGLPLVNVTP